MRVLCVLTFLLVAMPASAQVPGTDIYLLRVRDGMLAQLSAPENITARSGYDNQPAFLAAGDALRFTSIDSTGQADIWLAELQSGEVRPLTRNETSEYSPTPIPENDRFSVVRVEPDSIQRLWSFAADGSSPQLLLEEPAGVGYHAWGEEGELILFVLGEPHELHRAIAGQPGSGRVAVDIGRCLQRIPGEDAWSFPLAAENGGWTITRLDRVTGEMTALAPSPTPEAQDYCWTAGGELWSSDGTSILAWRDGEWQTERNLTPDGIREISRMASSPDGQWLAFVADDSGGNR